MHTVHFKCIMKSEVVIFLSFRKKNKQNTCLCEFQNILKGLLFHCQKFVDQKYLWRSRISGTFEIHYKKGWFFHKIFDNSHLKFGKMKKGKH